MLKILVGKHKKHSLKILNNPHPKSNILEKTSCLQWTMVFFSFFLIFQFRQKHTNIKLHTATSLHCKSPAELLITLPSASRRRSCIQVLTMFSLWRLTKSQQKVINSFQTGTVCFSLELIFTGFRLS